jgi:hypothetical protein
MTGGNLVAHGGFIVQSGAFEVTGLDWFPSTVTLDAGNTFTLQGGELDVTDPEGLSALGSLTIDGDFVATGGVILVNVDTSGAEYTYGQLTVNGNVTLGAGATFSSRDINPAPGVVNQDWTLVTWAGTRKGSFFVDVPASWSAGWDDTNGQLVVHEP